MSLFTPDRSLRPGMQIACDPLDPNHWRTIASCATAEGIASVRFTDGSQARLTVRQSLRVRPGQVEGQLDLFGGAA